MSMTFARMQDLVSREHLGWIYSVIALCKGELQMSVTWAMCKVVGCYMQFACAVKVVFDTRYAL